MTAANIHRINDAQAALDAYIATGDKDVPSAAIGDLIADLLHLARTIDDCDPPETIAALALRHVRSELDAAEQATWPTP